MNKNLLLKASRTMAARTVYFEVLETGKKKEDLIEIQSYRSEPVDKTVAP